MVAWLVGVVVVVGGVGRRSSRRWWRRGWRRGVGGVGGVGRGRSSSSRSW